MQVSGHFLQDLVKVLPWWVALGYLSEDDTWLPGDINAYYMLHNPGGNPGDTMADVEEYAAQATSMLQQLQAIVGLTRDWKQRGQS